jgi:NTE family protein
MTADRTVSLVLGSGGARGLAHIGVIKWLEAAGFRIVSIAGSSMGALVGGIYAAGKLDVYRDWVLELERIDVLRLLDFSFGRNGLIKGDRVIGVLRELVGERAIEDLSISFTAVATDLDAQREVWLNRGPLFDAIRASIAIPTVFTPVSWRGHTLVDGGLVNPMPIAPTLRDKSALTIAVNVSAKDEPSCGRPERGGARTMHSAERHDRITEFLATLQQIVSGDTRDEAEEARGMHLFDVIARSMDTMQSTIARFQLAAYSPDAIVQVPGNACAFFEFWRARELIELGRERAEQSLRPLLLAPERAATP